jgi:hypothetical protein
MQSSPRVNWKFDSRRLDFTATPNWSRTASACQSRPPADNPLAEIGAKRSDVPPDRGRSSTSSPPSNAPCPTPRAIQTELRSRYAEVGLDARPRFVFRAKLASPRALASHCAQAEDQRHESSPSGLFLRHAARQPACSLLDLIGERRMPPAPPVPPLRGGCRSKVVVGVSAGPGGCGAAVGHGLVGGVTAGGPVSGPHGGDLVAV